MENIEHTHTQKITPDEHERHSMFLHMQNALLRRAGCTPEDNTQSKQWIERHAERLRELVTEDPGILGRWAVNQEKTLDEIEERLNR